MQTLLHTYYNKTTDSAYTSGNNNIFNCIYIQLI